MRRNLRTHAFQGTEGTSTKQTYSTRREILGSHSSGLPYAATTQFKPHLGKCFSPFKIGVSRQTVGRPHD